MAVYFIRELTIFGHYLAGVFIPSLLLVLAFLFCVEEGVIPPGCISPAIVPCRRFFCELYEKSAMRFVSLFGCRCPMMRAGLMGILGVMILVVRMLSASIRSL